MSPLAIKEENDRILKKINALVDQEKEIRKKMDEVKQITDMIDTSDDLSEEFREKYSSFCSKFQDEIENHLMLSESCITYLRSKQNSNN